MYNVGAVTSTRLLLDGILFKYNAQTVLYNISPYIIAHLNCLFWPRLIFDRLSSTFPYYLKLTFTYKIHTIPHFISNSM